MKSNRSKTPDIESGRQTIDITELKKRRIKLLPLFNYRAFKCQTSLKKGSLNRGLFLFAISNKDLDLQVG
jgi:hypothetical protein